MSFAQTAITITPGTDFHFTVPGDSNTLLGFTAYNTSGVDLIVRWNGMSRWLPASVLDWFQVDGQLSGDIVFSTGQNPNFQSVPTQTVLINLYPSYDTPPSGVFPTYVGRISNIGTTAVTTAQQLQGSGQSFALTETDAGVGGPPVLAPAANNQTVRLSARNAGGALVGGLEVSGAGTTVSGRILQVNGATLATTGIAPSVSWGVAGIVGFIVSQLVTATTQQTIVSFNTTGGGDTTYRISGHVILNNGVSGNSISFKVSYTNSSGTAITHSLPLLAPAGVTVASGTNSFSNATFPALVTPITAKTGTTITITYQDPTNTPNDLVTAILEELS